MATITIKLEVDRVVASGDSEGWAMVEESGGYGVSGNDRCVSCGATDTANGLAPHDGDRKAVRFFGKYVIKKRTGVSQARLKDYYMAVRHEAGVVAADGVIRSRHRPHKRNGRDFVAIVYKLILVADAEKRWSGMMNWNKLLKADADIAEVPRKQARKPRSRKM